MTTLYEIKQHNKKIGQYFFDRGNAPVIAKREDYLLTRGFGGVDFAVFKYDKKSGDIRYKESFETRKKGVSFMESKTMTKKG